MGRRGSVVIYVLIGILAASVLGLTGDEILRSVYDSTNTALRANIVVGGGSGISGLTTNTIPKATSATAIGDSNLKSNAAGVDVQALAYQLEFPNDTVTGTTLNKFVKYSASGKVIVAASTTDAVIGICVAGCGTTGNATVAVLGQASCVFDNAQTADHYATVSSVGGCHDSGTALPTGLPVIGQIPATNTAGTHTVFLNTPDVAAATVAGGSGKLGGSGTANQIAFFTAGATLGGSANLTFDRTNFRLAMANLTTANDNATSMVKWSGTMPTLPTAAVVGEFVTITGAGSAAQDNYAMDIVYAAGYTGANLTAAAQFVNSNAGTGTTLSLTTSNTPALNVAFRAVANGTGTGWDIGVLGDAAGSSVTNSTAYRIGGLFRSTDGTGTAAQPHIGVLAAANNSAEGTNLKNVALYGSLGASIITASNISAVQINDNGTTAGSIFRGYDNSVLVFDIADVSGTAVNGFQWNGQATGTNPNLTVTGDTNLGFDVISKGTGSFRSQHISGRGTAPTITASGGSCGTGDTIAGTDTAGKVTVGTGTPTSCVITFNATWAAAPFCVLNDESAISATARFSATSTTTATITVGTADASAVLDYHCMG